MLDLEFKLLKLINDNKDISQRKLSKATGMSLGKINKEIKRFIEDKYLVIEGIGNGITYTLTNKGIARIEAAVNLYNSTKLCVNREVGNKSIDTAVLLAAGSQKEFSCPVTLLPVGQTTLLGRIIKLLRQNNINNIIVVGGYEVDTLKKYLDDDINIVTNMGYETNGTMHSLQMVKNIVKDDFILIESDLIFEERILQDILSCDYRDCACIASATMIGHESYVEIRDEFIYKISKDIRQFNKVDGKFMGITKMSYKLFELMLDEYKYNKNPLINYEYTLLDVARKYNINYIHIGELIWGEVNNLKEYDYIKDNIFKKIKATE